MQRNEFKSTLNNWERKGIPFLFVIDFELEKPIAWRLDQVNPRELLYDFNGFTNADQQPRRKVMPVLVKHPIAYANYADKFNLVMRHLSYGDSFITNLTIKTEIEINESLQELFYVCHAPYKIWIKDHFLVFSPETFVRIKDGIVLAFPMKGTINAMVDRAQHKILANQKEEAEHVTIVDLLRNDLSMVATNVRLKRFRYIERISTSERDLLQVSSEISGVLTGEPYAGIGDVLLTLLPAGSVSGAPKEKTLDIIKKAEGEKRGYYTGVCGYFDGTSLDSGVMIRFIEHAANKYFYRSGGGITTQSEPLEEYQEALDKIYVPIN